MLQLALPASWPHGRVRGVSRLGNYGAGDREEGSTEAPRPLARAAGGWREVAAVVREGEGEAPLPDAWAWDEEEQGTLWVRVSSAASAAVKVVLAFEE